LVATDDVPFKEETIRGSFGGRRLHQARSGKYGSSKCNRHIFHDGLDDNAIILVPEISQINLKQNCASRRTIRLKLIKIGALVCISIRRIKIAMASACPAAQDWGRAAVRLAIAAIARASPA
jgi:hypothetical protein